MQLIENTEFGGERPLFGRRALDLRGVSFLPGESALKCTAAVSAARCDFNGKYPLWHTDGFTVADSVFRPGARAAIWYSRNARILSPVTSIKNPRAGRIVAASVGEVITDDFSKAVEPVEISVVG